jgi:hypothetical protein
MTFIAEDVSFLSFKRPVYLLIRNLKATRLTSPFAALLFSAFAGLLLAVLFLLPHLAALVLGTMSGAPRGACNFPLVFCGELTPQD